MALRTESLTQGRQQPLQGVPVPQLGDVEDVVEAHLTRHPVLLQVPEGSGTSLPDVFMQAANVDFVPFCMQFSCPNASSLRGALLSLHVFRWRSFQRFVPPTFPERELMQEEPLKS